MSVITEAWSHKVNANVQFVLMDGPDYWYAVRWQRRGGEGGERFHDRQQAQEFFTYMTGELMPPDAEDVLEAGIYEQHDFVR